MPERALFVQGLDAPLRHHLPGHRVPRDSNANGRIGSGVLSVQLTQHSTQGVSEVVLLATPAHLELHHFRALDEIGLEVAKVGGGYERLGRLPDEGG